MRHRTTWGFKEELTPQGTEDFKFITPHYAGLIRTAPKGTLVTQVTSHPWFIVIWEPLTTKVPGPQLTHPYCCYARTVIFYLRGYITNTHSQPYNIGGKWGTNKPGTVFQKWHEMEHTFHHDDLIEFNGETFVMGGGGVVWHNKRWWMRRIARRKKT